MSSEEAKQIVIEGLERRKAEREAQKQEARLDSYEQDMLDAISEKAAAARKNEKKQQNRESIRAMRSARKLEEEMKDAAAEDAIRRYGYTCFIIMMVATWTPIPWYGAAALMAGLAVLTAAYIFRLYYPLKEVNQNGKCTSSL